MKRVHDRSANKCPVGCATSRAPLRVQTAGLGGRNNSFLSRSAAWRPGYGVKAVAAERRPINLERASNAFETARLNLTGFQPELLSFDGERYELVYRAVTGWSFCSTHDTEDLKENSELLKGFICDKVEQGWSPHRLVSAEGQDTKFSIEAHAGHAETCTMFSLGELARFFDLCVQHKLMLIPW